MGKRAEARAAILAAGGCECRFCITEVVLGTMTPEMTLGCECHPDSILEHEGRNETLRRLSSLGLSYRDMGRILGVSGQRAYQILGPGHGRYQRPDLLS